MAETDGSLDSIKEDLKSLNTKDLKSVLQYGAFLLAERKRMDLFKLPEFTFKTTSKQINDAYLKFLKPIEFSQSIKLNTVFHKWVMLLQTGGAVTTSGEVIFTGIPEEILSAEIAYQALSDSSRIRLKNLEEDFSIGEALDEYGILKIRRKVLLTFFQKSTDNQLVKRLSARNFSEVMIIKPDFLDALTIGQFSARSPLQFHFKDSPLSTIDDLLPEWCKNIISRDIKNTLSTKEIQFKLSIAQKLSKLMIGYIFLKSIEEQTTHLINTPIGGDNSHLGLYSKGIQLKLYRHFPEDYPRLLEQLTQFHTKTELLLKNGGIINEAGEVSPLQIDSLELITIPVELIEEIKTLYPFPERRIANLYTFDSLLEEYGVLMLDGKFFANASTSKLFVSGKKYLLINSYLISRLTYIVDDEKNIPVFSYRSPHRDNSTRTIPLNLIREGSPLFASINKFLPEDVAQKVPPHVILELMLTSHISKFITRFSNE